MSDDIFEGASSRNTGGRGNNLPAGYYPQLRLVKAFFGPKQNLDNARCFIATFEVLEGPSDVPVGTMGDQFEQLEKTKFKEHAVEARGRTMKTVGSLFGFKSKTEIDANVNTAVVLQVCGDAQPMVGTVVSAVVRHIERPNKPTLARFDDVSPVIDPATGKVKVVRGKVGTNANTSALVSALVPAPVAPVPPPAPAAPAIPAGWLAHPQAPGWFYNPANPSEMKQAV